MATTSRSLTARRRDIIAQLVNDDPQTADLLFELFVITDQTTATGAAAREDVVNQLYSFTPHSKNGMKARTKEILTSCLALVTCALYVVG